MAAFVGQNTDVDASAERLSPTTLSVAYGIRIKAHPENTGIVYVGLSDQVTASTGFALAAGEAESFDRIFSDDATDIWVIGSGANQKVCYWGA